VFTFDIFDLAATATCRNNLTTVVDAGISVLHTPGTQTPVLVVSVIKMSFMGDHEDREYLCVLEVVGPDEQVRISKDIKINTIRPPGTHRELPIANVLITPLPFIPAEFGLFTVKFYLAGEATREAKLLIHPVHADPFA
jgi:hypothetical protein